MARREKGEGSLYQAKNKSWVYQYKVDGKRKTKRFQRKSDARAFIASLNTAEAAGRAENGPQRAYSGVSRVEVITVGEWMDRWLEKYAKPTVVNANLKL